MSESILKQDTISPLFYFFLQNIILRPHKKSVYISKRRKVTAYCVQQVQVEKQLRVFTVKAYTDILFIEPQSVLTAGIWKMVTLILVTEQNELAVVFQRLCKPFYIPAPLQVSSPSFRPCFLCRFCNIHNHSRNRG